MIPTVYLQEMTKEFQVVPLRRVQTDTTEMSFD